MGDVLGHIDSHYAAHLESRPVRTGLVGRIDVDTCVIGGGFAGLHCARNLARAGQSVGLLEAKRVGWGASGRNGGFVSDGFAEGMDNVIARVGIDRAKRMFALSVEGADTVRTSIREMGRDDLIAGTGGLKLSRVGDASSLLRQADLYETHFLTQRTFLDRKALSDMVKSDRYQSALFNKNAFHIDPLRYAEALADDAERFGAQVFEGTAARHIFREKDRWYVETEQGTLRAQSVVVATSVYGGVLPKLARALVPVATYVVSARSPNLPLRDVIPFNGTMADTRRAGDYFRVVGERDDARLIWGGRITTRRSQPSQLARFLRDDIESVFPQLSGIDIERAWIGLMGYTRHKMPLIGKFWPKNSPNLWACTGFGGHGLNTTAMGGRLVADGILGQSDTWKEFDSYRPDWVGGIVGRAAAQAKYWQMQYADWREERADQRI
ncbi:MAG: FAD-binding oxidoreductase [Pseudomonadota bacterium]